MIQYLLHQQLSCSCSRGDAAVTVLIELYISAVGSRATRNCPYARSHFPHVIIFSISSLQPLKYCATDIKRGFWSGHEKQERDVGKNHLPAEDVQWQPKQISALVCLYLEFEWSFNACMSLPQTVPNQHSSCEGCRP